MVAQVPKPSASTLAALEASLLNTSGGVALHNRFRALFTLKALKNDDAVKIISKGVGKDRTVPAMSLMFASTPLFDIQVSKTRAPC